MSKADKAREAAHMMVGFPYGLGWESSPTGLPNPRYDVNEGTAAASRGDCSGDFWSILVYAGITIGGRLVTKSDRRTADGWWHYPGAVRLKQPSVPGDFPVLLDSGTDHAHHIGMFLGNDEVFQMGNGHQTADIRPVSYWNTRAGIRWARLPGADFGKLTPAVPGYQDWDSDLKKPMSDPRIKLLKVWLNGVFDLDETNPAFLDWTEKVVRAFQFVFMGPDSVDGVVGDQTQAAIYKVFQQRQP
jgi:hypothetical protein